MKLRPFSALILISAAVHAQSLLSSDTAESTVHPLPTDAAILESAEARTDLACTVKQIPPQLGFDLRFHAGFEATVPFSELVGDGNSLTAVFRVTPENRPDDPVYFAQKWSVPPVSEAARGRAEMRGAFALGEGRYTVDWLLRERAGRICSMRWNVVVDPRGRDKQVPLTLTSGAVDAELDNIFTVETAQKHPDGQPFKVLILFHAAPQTSVATTMREADTRVLLSILRRIAKEPRIGTYSMVAFNLDQTSVLYRARDRQQLDFPALGDALKQLQLGTVEVRKLMEKESPSEFLGKILGEEMISSRPDAVIFVGPRTVEPNALSRSVKDFGGPECSVFYLSYTPDPISTPWRDTIGNLVKLWKGSEYIISKPADLSLAWTDVVSRMSGKSVQSHTSDISVAGAGVVPDNK